MKHLVIHKRFAFGLSWFVSPSQHEGQLHTMQVLFTPVPSLQPPRPVVLSLKYFSFLPLLTNEMGQCGESSPSSWSVGMPLVLPIKITALGLALLPDEVGCPVSPVNFQFNHCTINFQISIWHLRSFYVFVDFLFCSRIAWFHTVLGLCFFINKFVCFFFSLAMNARILDTWDIYFSSECQPLFDLCFFPDNSSSIRMIVILNSLSGAPYICPLGSISRNQILIPLCVL